MSARGVVSADEEAVTDMETMRSGRQSRLWWQATAGVLCAWLVLGATLAQAVGATLPLWEARGPRGTVYLFGSVHVCSAGCFPLSAAVLKRFDASQRLVLELDPTNAEVQSKLMTAAALPPGNPGLDRLLSAEDLRRLRSVMAQLGLPEEVVFRFQPWMATTLLTLAAAEKEGLDASQGIDMWMLQRAQARGMPLTELETPERQIAALSSGSTDEQVQDLRATLDMFEKQRIGGYLRELVEAWRQGDGVRLQRLLAEEQGDDDVMRTELLDRRNVEMAAKIAQLSESGETVFVVIGVAHLVGPHNVGELLAGKGFQVRQLRADE